MSLVLDSNIFVAAARNRDPHRSACRSLLSGSREPRVVPAATLVEIEYFLRGTGRFVELLDDIETGGLHVVDLDGPMLRRVRELLEAYADLRVGFVDCAVLAVVEHLQEPKLATLDRRHFTVMRPRHVDALELLPA